MTLETITLEDVLAPLSDDARMLANKAALSDDWGDGIDDVYAALWDMCEVLRPYESPRWGNTGGRYGHSGGFLNSEDWDAIDRLDYEWGEQSIADGDLDVHNWHAVVTYGTWCKDNGEGDLVELADRMSAVIDTAREG